MWLTSFMGTKAPITHRSRRGGGYSAVKRINVVRLQERHLRHKRREPEGSLAGQRRKIAIRIMIGMGTPRNNKSRERMENSLGDGCAELQVAVAAAEGRCETGYKGAHQQGHE